MSDNRKWWFALPKTIELENMRRLIRPDASDTCPQCNIGRLVIEIYHDPLWGCMMTAVCRYNPTDCDFSEVISDDDR